MPANRENFTRCMEEIFCCRNIYFWEAKISKQSVAHAQHANNETTRQTRGSAACIKWATVCGYLHFFGCYGSYFPSPLFHWLSDLFTILKKYVICRFLFIVSLRLFATSSFEILPTDFVAINEIG